VQFVGVNEIRILRPGRNRIGISREKKSINAVRIAGILVVRDNNTRIVVELQKKADDIFYRCSELVKYLYYILYGMRTMYIRQRTMYIIVYIYIYICI